MRFRFTFLLACACAVLAYSSAWCQSTLTITIMNLKNNNGDILVGLYDKAAGFPRHVLDGKVVKVTDDHMKVSFKDIKPGNYAVSVLHDENQNKDMDQTRLGIPKEGYGFSNNAKGVMGPPSFKKAQIAVAKSKDTDITIKMKYMK
jgi:uncharacterized protein (DUF2141 family)